MVKAAAPAAVPRNLRRLELLDICLLRTVLAAAHAAARSYDSRNNGKGPGGMAAKADLRDGAQGHFRRRLDAEAVPSDLYRGLGGAAAHDKARGMKLRQAWSAAGGGPGDVQFQVATHGKRPATLETDSVGTHVMNRAGIPMGSGPLAGQAKLNRERQAKPSPGTPFYLSLI